ncbi:MAG: VOC family protein [Candidatus Hadarchaeota archaeon]
MIKGIGHVAYVVEDLGESLDFYCGVLGFEKLFTLENDEGETWLVYLHVGDGEYVELFPSDKVDERTKGRIGYHHLCLEVEDIEEIAQKMRDAGVELTSEPTKGEDGNYQCWVEDPDGNSIEFMQMMPDSLQRHAVD